VVARVRGRLAVSKQTAQNFDVGRFREANELKVRKQYHINTLRTGEADLRF